MLTKILFLLYPSLILAIQVTILAKDEDNIEVSFVGKDKDIISDKEAEVFQLTDEKLKEAIATHTGRQPDDVFIKSPTPWGDLYGKYGWVDVERTLTPKSGRLVRKKSEKVHVTKQNFENMSSNNATYTVTLSKPLQETLNVTWIKATDIFFPKNISHELELFQFGGKQTFFTVLWGEDMKKSEKVDVGSEFTLELNVRPGEIIEVEIKSTKVTLEVELLYEATLTGDVVINFESPYMGHHFWSIPIHTILTKPGFNEKVVVKEIIDMEFYSRNEIIMNDVTQDSDYLE